MTELEARIRQLETMLETARRDRDYWQRQYLDLRAEMEHLRLRLRHFETEGHMKVRVHRPYRRPL